MANRKNKFLLKRSSVAGKVPSDGSLLLGELALNTADVVLYASGTTENTILPIGWDRVSKTGDTMDGNFIINGDLTVTGNTFFNKQILDIYQSGTTTTSGGAYTDLVWDSVIVIDSDYSYSSGEITFGTSGYYEVSYSVSMDVNVGGRKTSRSRLSLDNGSGYNEIPRSGSFGYHRSTTQGQGSISKTIRQQFLVGDKIKLQISRATGGGSLITIAGDSNITINKISS